MEMQQLLNSELLPSESEGSDYEPESEEDEQKGVQKVNHKKVDQIWQEMQNSEKKEKTEKKEKVNNPEQTISQESALETVRNLKKRKQEELDKKEIHELKKKQKMENIVSQACQKQESNSMLKSVLTWEAFRTRSELKDKFDNHRKDGFLQNKEFKMKSNERIKSFMKDRKRKVNNYADFE